MTDDRQVTASTPNAEGGAHQRNSMARFIALRVDPQLAYFEKAASRAKRSHQALVSTQLIATASIPIANALTNSVLLSTILAGVAAVATGLINIFSHHENWIRYRRNAGALEALKVRYELGLEPFTDENRDAVFAEAVEKILSGESEQWTSHVKASVPGASKSHKTSAQTKAEPTDDA